MPRPRDVQRPLTTALLCSSLGVFVGQAQAITWDGNGHYALRGEIQTAPGMAKDSGQFQAIDQSFRLLGEARVNDNSSFFMELRLFEDPSKAYLGDTPQPRECSKGEGEACQGEHQNVREPGYKPYAPKVSKAYARYAFDYCILEAGRRGRQWGMGIFLDAGNDPFATDMSVYDGISCDINIQKSQTLGVSFGYDKLAETGTYIRETEAATPRRFGATNPNDDINQFYLTIEFDDRKANAGAAFTKQIGIYAAKLSSAQVGDGGSSTDLNFIDLYASLYFQNVVIQNEVLLTLGKTADPNITKLGGALYDKGDPAVNKLNSLALAGNLEWTLTSSGAHVGPAQYRQGDARRHLLFLNYAYAPGDSQGYYSDNAPDSDGPLSGNKRSRTAKAVAFHRNFKPALIMFHGRSEIRDLAVDGIFDPQRVMNAQVYSLGYRYESLAIGNFEVKGTYGLLNESMPSDVESHYAANANLSRPIGYYGSDLGMELDLMYWHHWNQDVDFGVAAAALVPGDAWRTKESARPTNNYLGQAFVAFRF